MASQMGSQTSCLKWRPLPVPLDAGTNTAMPVKTIVVDEEHCYPCRRCLQDGEIGEKMLFVSYVPWLGDSPYRQSGPIFVHEEPKCDLAEVDGTSTTPPDQQARHLLSVRQFDKDHMMKAADVYQGTELIQRAKQALQNDEIDYIHVYNAIPGCFAVRIERAARSE